jgi:hypothetical protein
MSSITKSKRWLQCLRKVIPGDGNPSTSMSVDRHVACDPEEPCCCRYALASKARKRGKCLEEDLLSEIGCLLLCLGPGPQVPVHGVEVKPIQFGEGLWMGCESLVQQSGI